MDAEMGQRNHAQEISYERPDPILVAQRYQEPYSALVCALFAYGRADLIVRFLDGLDFRLLDAEESAIRRAFEGQYYRFQNRTDIIEFFITLRRLKLEGDIEALFTEAYRPNRSVIDGVNAVIAKMQALNGYESRGYRFLVGREVTKYKGGAPMKRWLMFLRWMVRSDAIDFGLWQGVGTSDLLMPLDTHTFNVSRRLGLLQRKSYDLQAVAELTESLKRFDPDDPVKYDFALYRLGQEKQY
ncbi:TIGR02757 family protein [Sulfurimonas diazotrophicus]|uniref:TIGR02757 family protein n=1 Tax=Sulfurimonas diazotrophicus TaxID=3131939 RepID=A0ABZ3HCP6_9BACT